VVPPTGQANGPWTGAAGLPSLQRVANRPIICHVLEALAAAGVTEVAVVMDSSVAPEAASCLDEERSPGVNVRQLVHEPRAEPAAALCAAADFVADAYAIVHRADGLVGQPLGPFFESLNGEDAPDMVLLMAERARNAEPLGPATREMLPVAALHPAKATLGVAGACLMAPGAMRVGRSARLVAPVLLPAALAEGLIASRERRVQIRVARDWRSFAGDPLDLLDMNGALLDTLAPEAHIPELDGNRFEGRIHIDPTATVRSSVICGPVIVGAGAHIADSYIGPHTSIGARVVVEGTEIERSIVLAGASILHVGGRLVASVVGRDARVFRDFSVPRALRLLVGDGNQVALC
jgi:glucose-1-phosphate thymidylyltransferase